MSKERPQKLTKKEVIILRKFADCIAECATDSIGAPYEHMSHVLNEYLRTRMDRFDWEVNDPEVWKGELHAFARDMLSEILTSARQCIQECMGEKAWTDLGKPFEHDISCVGVTTAGRRSPPNKPSPSSPAPVWRGG